MFTPTKLVVDIRVQDLGRAVAFYRDILGFPLLRHEQTWASFLVVGAEIHLYVYGGTTTGLEFRVSDIEDAVTTLKRKSVVFLDNFVGEKPQKISPAGVMYFNWGKGAYFNDSEGNRLALVED
ncbi:MAG: hypothetical protein A2664_00960 [Candidatus Taylorbacteria bacterium RIFCSPHIGHO2_01_FULL_46_22b]|uniref:VOC domain-containing protein n=1 Tax=Candidatus Taylorbacteria bacterium RIFCSPHIGHO2_01_FULL_46_22b TaxID=1802301 RepID=A0A1G2M3Q1_9BACT|nr:MAG: hypothetical protein A2664_00960 [Candidatus Taylorbacteria bacterium RIFCSPHIGHO2_01_FULL_46_22b]